MLVLFIIIFERRKPRLFRGNFFRGLIRISPYAQKEQTVAIRFFAQFQNYFKGFQAKLNEAHERTYVEAQIKNGFLVPEKIVRW